jgi:hypothetical protein
MAQMATMPIAARSRLQQKLPAVASSRITTVLQFVIDRIGLVSNHFL